MPQGTSLGIVGTVLSVFLLLFVGYGTKKVRLLRPADAELLNSVVIYLTLPAFVFEALYSYRQPIPLSIAKVPILGFATMLVVLALAYATGRALRLDRRKLGGLMMVSIFGNTGFLGYPVVRAAFAEKGALVTAVMYDELGMALPLYTVGVAIAMAFGGERLDRGYMLNFFKLPLIWTMAVALLLRPFELPGPFLDAVGYLGGGTIPLVMISLGLSLSASSLKGMAAPVTVACLLKMGLLPLLTHYALTVGGVEGIMRSVTVLESGMPTALMAGVVAARFGADGKFAAGVIFVSTLLSIVTIPATLLILGVS